MIIKNGSFLRDEFRKTHVLFITCLVNIGETFLKIYPIISNVMRIGAQGNGYLQLKSPLEYILRRVYTNSFEISCHIYIQG